MFPYWALFAGIEVAWLLGLWLCVPESRPWHREPTPDEVTQAASRSTLIPTLFLLPYFLYHLPALLVSIALYGGRLGDVQGSLDFIVLGVFTGIAYALAGQWFLGG